MPIQLEVTITYRYTVSDETADEVYGTRDPKAMAEIDQNGLQDDPAPLFDDLAASPFTIAVNPVEA